MLGVGNAGRNGHSKQFAVRQEVAFAPILPRDPETGWKPILHCALVTSRWVRGRAEKNAYFAR
jgi:hypothetical protein